MGYTEVYLSDCISLGMVLLAAFLFREYYDQVRQPIDANYGKKALIDNYYLEWKRGEGVVNARMGFGYVSCEDIVVSGTPIIHPNITSFSRYRVDGRIRVFRCPQS